MSWVKLRDNWIESERVEDIGPEALALHLSALSYSARRETDGRVPRRALRRLYPVDDIEVTVKTLVASGLWLASGDDFEIDDWHEHLLSSVEMQKRRDQSATSSERYRRHKLDDHSMCDFCSAKKKARDDVTDAGTDDSSDAPRFATSRIATSRSVAIAEERDEDGRASSATAPHARPARTSEGWLVALDEQTLAALPFWFDNDDCPHRRGGRTWNAHDHLACDVCHRAACASGSGVDPTFCSPSLLTSQASSCGRGLSLREWCALLDIDPAGTTLALDLASVLFRKAGPPIPDSAAVNSLAEDIYRRSVSADRLAQIFYDTKEKTS